MHRTALVTAVTTALIVVAALLLLTAAAPAAPRWPAATLAYWQQAQPHLQTLDAQSKIALTAVGQPGSTQIISDAVTAVTSVVDAVAELDPPPALLPLHTQLTYAAGACQSTIQYGQTLKFDNLAAAVSINVFTQFGLECRRSIHAAQMEAARYAATVGGFPETP